MSKKSWNPHQSSHPSPRTLKPSHLPQQVVSNHHNPALHQQEPTRRQPSTPHHLNPSTSPLPQSPSLQV
ncbi:hypothetical protein BC829DRAFT_400366 [Chytridium lagenaria]|nr:hypothetical protein BC829DRAFT_400366 [Chytridium lagenaria]